MNKATRQNCSNQPSGRQLAGATGVAAVLWFLMFSKWTAGLINFWLEMSIAALILFSLSIAFTPLSKFKIRQILLGIAIAFILWGIFWVGDRLSSMMFTFARPGVDAVYSMKAGLPDWAICALLLLLIGPAEEFFWRGFIQNNLQKLLEHSDFRFPADHAFVFTAAVYALVHIWSFNFMLVMAALVAGAVWGFIYRLRPGLLPALIVSHAVWDALVFVILPI